MAARVSQRVRRLAAGSALAPLGWLKDLGLSLCHGCRPCTLPGAQDKTAAALVDGGRGVFAAPDQAIASTPLRVVLCITRPDVSV